MKLYELTGTAAELYALLENEEIDEQTLKDTLEALGADEKIDGCCKVIKQLEAEAEAIKAETERLKKRETSLKNNAKYIRQNIISYLQATGQKSLKTLLFTVSQRTTQAVEIAEGANVPQEYITLKPEVNKTALKKALADGKEIEGVSLVSNSSLQIR